MRSQQDRLELLSKVTREAFDSGVAGCHAQGTVTDGRKVAISGRSLLNFASCSYLGLELDERLIEGAVQAVRTQGVQTCASRSYLSCSLYDELELLLSQIFGGHVVVAATTTLGHLSAIPTVVGEDDAIILDHQVHASVQMACKIVQAGGVHLEVVPHNGMARIERRVRELSKSHRQVWYMADGIHSMTGKVAPSTEIREMLDRHPKMRFYVDDAHGMSWCGNRGSGSILDEFGLHPQMIFTTGLGKGFGTGGGVIVLPDREQCDEIRRCGPTLIFGGPLQPAILGAATESARIHLTDEIYALQADLNRRIEHRNELARSLGVPMTSSPETPVSLVAMGPIKAAQALCKRLVADGFYINPAQFPALPVRRSGGRFLLTRHHTFDDIEQLVSSIARHWEPALKEGGSTPDEIARLFKIELPERPVKRWKTTSASLYLESSESIEKLNAAEWDQMMGDRGCLSSRALCVFERVFGQESAPEKRWDFRYYIVRDASGAPVLATCFTKALWKADMLSPASVSQVVEASRAEDPLFLTQTVFGMGCLLSEGDHLWLDPSAGAGLRRQAIRLLLDSVRRDSDQLDCEMRVFRDIPNDAKETLALLEQEGLIRIDTPDGHVVENLAGSEEEQVAALSARKRAHYRREVAPWNEFYSVELVGEGELDEGDLAELYALYENVKDGSFSLNTFALPESILGEMVSSADFEITRFRAAKDGGAVVGFGAAFTGQSAYVPLFLGMDLEYGREHGLYRQMLRDVFARARGANRDQVLLGFGASLEKRRFGAKTVASSMFVEADDHFAFDALAQVTTRSD